MKAKFNQIAVTSIISVLPKERFDLLSLADQFGESVIRRIVESTGVASIRKAPSGTQISDLYASACQKLFEQFRLTAADVDGVIVVTQTPDQKVPATSMILAHKLGLSKNAITLDINSGCSGYVYGLFHAHSILAASDCNNILLCVGDVITPFLKPEDRNVRMLLGDGASVTLIRKDENNKQDSRFILRADGSGAQHIHLNHGDEQYLFMDGSKVMEFALSEVPLIINDALGYAAWAQEEVGNFILHQANTFILNCLRKKLSINQMNFPIAIDGIGNTASASIPLVLSENFSSKNASEQLRKVVLCGFGSGLSWGTCSLDLSNTVILPTIEY